MIGRSTEQMFSAATRQFGEGILMTDLPEEDRVKGEQREGAQPAKKKPLLSASRIALLLFVIVAAVAIVFEWRARGSYTRTVELLNERWDKAQESGEDFYRDDLEELIQGSPSKVYDEETRTETFAWGMIRARRLEVEYGDLDVVKSFRTL
jgi:hypothetical protein